MNETRELVRFVVDTEFDGLPADVVELAKVYMLDNIASGCVGSVQPWSKMVAELVRDAKSSGECTVFGQHWKTSASGAAFVNGTMIEAFETSHAYFPGSAHPSSAVFPAVMAIAEREHVDGRTFLTATILGYESICRIGDAATRAVEEDRGYHGPGTNAPFGAAIGVGKLLGFDQERLTHAMGIAGSHGAGLLEFMLEGAMTKRIHVGRGCQMGLESALLAGKGFTGPSTVLEGKYGFFNVFSPSPKPEQLLADLGKTWRMKNMMVKPFACHGVQQATVQALLKFKSDHPLDTKDIRLVEITCGRVMVEKHDDSGPTTILGAQYSTPFVVAIALTRDISNPLIFNEETLWDKDIRELAKRVKLVVDQQCFGSGFGLQASAVIELDKTRHIIDINGYKGSPEEPMDFNDICGKFRQYSVPVIGEKQTHEIIQMVANIERLEDVSELAHLIGCSNYRNLR